MTEHLFHIRELPKKIIGIIGSVGTRSSIEEDSQLSLPFTIRTNRPASLVLDLCSDSIFSQDQLRQIHEDIASQKAARYIPIEEAMRSIEVKIR
jgi:hypothetical protein